MVNRVIVWSLVAVLAMGTFLYVRNVKSGPEQKVTRVYFLPGGTNPFWQLTMAGARAAADQYEADVSFGTPDDTPQDQTRLLGTVGSSSFDGLAISPLAPDSQSEIINRLSESLDIVTFDSDAPGSRRRYYVGTNNTSAGRLCAQLVKQALPAGGKVALLMRTMDKDNAVLRHEGFVEELAASAVVAGDDDSAESVSYELIDTLIDAADPDKCRENVGKILDGHPDVGVIAGMFAFQGPIMLEVLERRGKLGEVQMVTFDEDERVLQGIADGHIFATVVQDPFKYGFEAVRMLCVLQHRGGVELPISGGEIFLPCEAITRDNVADYRARLAERLK